MTYKELYDDAMRMLEHNEINGGEFDKMIEPLNAEVGNAEPVRHGKWIRWRDLNGIKRCKCSECIVSYGNMDTPYCPNCGAKMDAEREEE